MQEMYQKQLEEMKIQLEHDKDVFLEEEKRITATVMEELEQVKQVQHSSEYVQTNTGLHYCILTWSA